MQGSALRIGWPRSWSTEWKQRRQRAGQGKKKRSPGRKKRKIRSPWMKTGMSNRVIREGKE